MISAHAQLTLSVSPTSAATAFASPHALTKVKSPALILITASALPTLNAQLAHVIKTPVSLTATPQPPPGPLTTAATAPTTPNASQVSVSQDNVSPTVMHLARLPHIKMAALALMILFAAREFAVEMELLEMVFASLLAENRDRIKDLISLDVTVLSMMNAPLGSVNLPELMQILANHYALTIAKMANLSMVATARPIQIVSSQTARATPATQVAIHHQLTVNTTPTVTAPPTPSVSQDIATSTRTSALLNATPWSSDLTPMDALAETMLPACPTLAPVDTVYQTVLQLNFMVLMASYVSALRTMSASLTSVSATNALPTALLSHQAF